MWETSNTPTAFRTVMCSSISELYRTGMLNPANGIIFAPSFSCKSLRGTFLTFIMYFRLVSFSFPTLVTPQPELWFFNNMSFQHLRYFFGNLTFPGRSRIAEHIHEATSVISSSWFLHIKK